MSAQIIDATNIVALRPVSPIIPESTRRPGRRPKNVVTLRPKPRTVTAKGLVKPSYRLNKDGKPIEPLAPEKIMAQREWWLNRRQTRAIELARQGFTRFDHDAPDWSVKWARYSMMQIMDTTLGRDVFPFLHYEPDHLKQYLVPLDEPITGEEASRFRSLMGDWMHERDFYGKLENPTHADFVAYDFFCVIIEGLQSALDARDAHIRDGRALPMTWRGLSRCYQAARAAGDGAARLEAFERLMSAPTENSDALLAKLEAMQAEGRGDFAFVLNDVRGMASRRARHA